MAEQTQTVGIDLARLRVEYSQRALSEQEVHANPFRQFAQWLDEAVAAKAIEPNAMTLATATPDGMPSARVVLLKAIDGDEFSFFTNYLSRKGRELAENPRAALVFWWGELERQVRIEGTVRRGTEAESDAYFNIRPPASRVGAAISTQSEPIASREVLEQRQRELLAQYPDGRVPRPAHWGGYRLRPSRFEFWQGRASRLHDRVEYLLEGPGTWKIRRLAP
jgi:pyridoxamine 5'-phosphate oxidase